MSFKNCQIVGVEVDPADYFKLEVARGDPAFPISSSGLRLFGECPSKWKAGAEEEDTASTIFGRLFDCVLLTHGRFNDSYVVRPASYPAGKNHKLVKQGKVKLGAAVPWSAQAGHCQQWVELNAPGPKGAREVVSPELMGQVEAAIKRLRADEILRTFIECSDRQVWVAGEWHDEVTGLVVPAKCLIDLAPYPDSDLDDSLGDVKTARNAKVRPWQSEAYKRGYHIQAAWNLWMFSEASGAVRRKFGFLISENVAPWEPGRRMVEASMLERGRNSIRRMMAEYCSCLKHDQWPGYDDTDEAEKGWSVWREEPWMEGQELFATRYNFPGKVKEGLEEASDPPWMKDEEPADEAVPAAEAEPGVGEPEGEEESA